MSHHAILDNIKALDFVNFQLAELTTIKQKLEAEIIELLDHHKEGSKTYEINKYKIIVKTDVIYSLDKSEYAVYKDKLSKEFNPVRESTKYTIDAKTMHLVDEYASAQELDILSKFITKKPAKPNVKITANV